jgi:hypothetical protein
MQTPKTFVFATLPCRAIPGQQHGFQKPRQKDFVLESVFEAPNTGL